MGLGKWYFWLTYRGHGTRSSTPTPGDARSSTSRTKIAAVSFCPSYPGPTLDDAKRLLFRPFVPMQPHAFLPSVKDDSLRKLKRSTNEEENTPRKKSKTTRGNADGKCSDASEIVTSSSGTHLAPKRGYTAKKRNEAAQIDTQSGRCHCLSEVTRLTIATIKQR